ncbi:MAG: carboxypeptidase regulatory-like domain-containing protein [Planctomycetes bacterium]|nr:carboxypeptidase regulatory-like domain-containing protein [Planctomycetota bacterium]
MKVLLPVLLVGLALGAGVFFLQLDADGAGRGTKDRPFSGRSAGPGAAPSAAPSGKRTPPTPEAGAGRQKVDSLAAPRTRGTFEGLVIGDGNPIPGASLSLVRDEQVLGEANTDEHGRFRLECAPLAAAATLRVRARGFVSLERPIAPRPAGGTALLGNVRLLRGQRIVGRVLDGRGRGIADAEVRVEPTNPGSDVLVAIAHTRPDGAFEVADAPPGTVSVTARAKGFGEQAVRYTASPTPFEIQLEPGVTLRLYLSGPRGRPVVGADVTVQAPSDVRGGRRTAKSDENGRVAFEGLGAPTWSVRVSHPEFRPSSLNQVAATETETVIECLPWPAIEGVVRAPAGKPPPPGTRVQALPASAPGDRIAQLDGGVEVGADGYFRLSGLRPGDWRVCVAAPGFAPTTSVPVKLGIEGDGYAGTIELRAGGSLALALVLGTEPVPGAELELFQSEPTPAQLWALQGSRGPKLGRRVTSGPDGRATFPDLSPGQVWVAVYAEVCPPARSGPHEVGSDPGAAAIRVELARGARIQGRVSSAQGTPLALAQLRIVESKRHLGFPLMLASDTEGHYTSAWLPPGRYTIEAFTAADPTKRSGPSEFELGPGEQRTLDLTL